MFVSDNGFVAIYPVKSKGDFHDTLHLFCKEVGVPVSLVVDPSGEQTSKSVKKFVIRLVPHCASRKNQCNGQIGLSFILGF